MLSVCMGYIQLLSTEEKGGGGVASNENVIWMTMEGCTLATLKIAIVHSVFLRLTVQSKSEGDWND